jgi:GntR family transcriptional regulator/MocR family aminotransferase
MNHNPQSLSLNLNKKEQTPLYRQAYQELRRMILHGELPPGFRLPSTRLLAHRERVSRNTIIQAYDQLQAEGFVTGRLGAGTYVAEGIAIPPADSPSSTFDPALSAWGRRVLGHAPGSRHGRSRLEIDFGFGRSFSHIFPYDVWRRLLARYLSTDDIMLSRYGSVAGFNPLRQAVAGYLARQRGVRCAPEQVVIISGAQQALDILARLLLAPGDEVLVETPGYKDAFTLFEVNGAALVPLSVDDDGFPVEKIPPECRARLVFITPSHQFPRGGTLSLPRRLTLLEWAKTRDSLIIEDDYDSELRYDGHPLAALQGLDESGHVIYLGTFSKVLFPALRLGYIVLPPPLLTPFISAKGLVDRGAPTLTQAAVADFLAEGHFERHLRHLRKAYGERHQALVEALESYLPGRVHFSSVPAGLHVMLYLHPSCLEKEVVRQAAASGVGVYPGVPFHLQQPAPPSILLGFSGLSAEQITEGIKRLATVIPAI